MVGSEGSLYVDFSYGDESSDNQGFMRRIFELMATRSPLPDT